MDGRQTWLEAAPLSVEPLGRAVEALLGTWIDPERKPVRNTTQHLDDIHFREVAIDRNAALS